MSTASYAAGVGRECCQWFHRGVVEDLDDGVAGCEDEFVGGVGEGNLVCLDGLGVVGERGERTAGNADDGVVLMGVLVLCT